MSLTRVRRSKAALAGAYSGQHPKIRAAIKPLVDAGQAYCAEQVCVKADRWIAPGSPWDLAHAPDGSYAGAAHRRCNRREAAIRRNKAISQVTVRHSRQW